MGKGIELQLSCGTLYVDSTPASEMLAEPKHVAARCLLDWVQSSAADGVSISGKGGEEELMIHVHDMALTVLYSTVGELAKAVQAASALRAPQIPPAVSCLVVKSLDGASCLRLVASHCQG